MFTSPRLTSATGSEFNAAKVMLFFGLCKNLFFYFDLSEKNSTFAEKFVVGNMHKSGFVNIVGNPNVGKSTLMNALVGERLSIITSKAQTTRHRILGILNGTVPAANGGEAVDWQIVFSDTPGVLKPNYRLQEQMLRFSESALTDADILIYMTEAQDDAARNADFLEKVKRTKAHLILVINKIDLLTQESLADLTGFWHKTLPDAEIVQISAQQRFGTDQLLQRLVELLPECPPFFDKDQLTDRPERFFVNEIIREKILLLYDKEIPYSVEVEVESFKETDDIINISAVIFVERDSQKGILIGKAGAALKKTGTLARQDLEKFFAKKICLKLLVKVDKDWRQKDARLRHYGYDPA